MMYVSRANGKPIEVLIENVNKWRKSNKVYFKITKENLREQLKEAFYNLIYW